jgi:hypothetical protein
MQSVIVWDLETVPDLGRLTDAEFQASEINLVDFIKARGNTKPHLADLT